MINNNLFLFRKKISMLGYVSESKLKNLLVALGDGERDCEAAR